MELLQKQMEKLPLGAVQANGWLLAQLRAQRDGLTGWLEEIWEDVGEGSAWLGGTGEDWERGPYYCDGLIPLAHLLGDRGLLEKAGRWVSHALQSARPDGFFWPWVERGLVAAHGDAQGSGAGVRGHPAA